MGLAGSAVFCFFGVCGRSSVDGRFRTRGDVLVITVVVVVVVIVSAVMVSGRGPSMTGAFVRTGAVIGAETGSSWVMVIILNFL